MKITFTGYCKGNQVFFRNQKNISKEILETGWTEFSVTVEKKKKNRSHEQNRWYWSCVTILADHTGYRKDEMHEVIKFKFCKAELVDEKTGEVYEYLKSTADMTTTEFSTLMDRLIQWSAEQFNIILPLPETQLTIL